MNDLPAGHKSAVWNLLHTDPIDTLEADVLERVAPMIHAWYLEMLESGPSEYLLGIGLRLSTLVLCAVDNLSDLFEDNDQEDRVYLFFGSPAMMRQFVTEQAAGEFDEDKIFETLNQGVAAYSDVLDILGLDQDTE